MTVVDGVTRPAPALVTELRHVIPAPPIRERERLAGLPADRELHARLCAEVEALNVVEDGRIGGAAKASWPLDVLFWNVERGRYLPALARRMMVLHPGVGLLCELDLGMARTRQEHTTRVLANALGASYVFGVEFIELGLGDGREQQVHAGESNEQALHGAAIVSRLALERPALIRLESDGDWFDDARGERRIGGRIAMAATVPGEGASIVVVSVHLESHGDPAQRAAQMRGLLECIEIYAPGSPVLIGGDLNTKSTSRAEAMDARSAAAALARDPGRFLDPVPHEPLFEVARAFGYEWAACNVPGAATTRFMPHHAEDRPAFKLDWFLARGLRSRGPRVVEALDSETGEALSDHEMLVVSVEPE